MKRALIDAFRFNADVRKNTFDIYILIGPDKLVIVYCNFSLTFLVVFMNDFYFCCFIVVQNFLHNHYCRVIGWFGGTVAVTLLAVLKVKTLAVLDCRELSV